MWRTLSWKTAERWRNDWNAKRKNWPQNVMPPRQAPRHALHCDSRPRRPQWRNAQVPHLIYLLSRRDCGNHDRSSRVNGRRQVKVATRAFKVASSSSFSWEKEEMEPRSKKARFGEVSEDAELQALDARTPMSTKTATTFWLGVFESFCVEKRLF